MAFRLYDLPEIEPSRLVGFGGNRIDRQSEKRHDDSAFTALELPETRVMVLGATNCCSITRMRRRRVHSSASAKPGILRRICTSRCFWGFRTARRSSP